MKRTFKQYFEMKNKDSNEGQDSSRNRSIGALVLGIRTKYFRSGLMIFVGILLGWLFFHSPKQAGEIKLKIEVKKEIWTCSMDPQIKKDQPGKCPICGMDLIPLHQEATVNTDSSAIQLSSEAIQLANVATSVISRQQPLKEVRLFGKILPDERLTQTQTAHISGRLEKLFVNFTGESVHYGQVLAVVYSPDLVTAQQELLEASKSKLQQPEIYEASKERLRQWKLTDSQLTVIEKTGKIKTNVEIVSNTAGIVTAKRVNVGDYVSQGTVLFEITSLKNLWVVFDAYESDLSFLKQGNKVSFTVQALPGIPFSGNIQFIDPVIDPVTRVAKVRVEVSNANGKLKPEMFVNGIVKANLDQYHDKLVVPRSAVLWTGKRSVVYVKQQNKDASVFNLREIELGPALGNSFVVLSGLKEGEEIVTDGTFNVDAAAQLEGKPSMMNK